MMREVGSLYAYLSREIFGELELGVPHIIEHPKQGMLKLCSWDDGSPQLFQ